MKPLHYTASALALGLALMGNAQAVTTIPFWHSMEGELGKEVDSLAQRFNAENPDYKIVPTYKGNYEQNLSAGIAAFRTGNAPAILQVYEVGTATLVVDDAIRLRRSYRRMRELFKGIPISRIVGNGTRSVFGMRRQRRYQDSGKRCHQAKCSHSSHKAITSPVLKPSFSILHFCPRLIAI